MKFSLVAVAAAMVAGASASQHHQHESFHKRGAFARAAHNVTDLYVPAANGTEECGCYTTWVTTYGEPTLAPRPPKAKPTTSEAPVEVKPTPTPEEIKPIPTPEEVKPTTSEAENSPVETIVVPVVPQPTAEVSVFPTPGTYTIPATTITVTKETTVCEATTTAVPSGTHTFGGLTTIVETATTIVCPIATVETTNGVATSTIRETTYVCPSAGTYTIAPTTSAVVESTVFVYPTPHVVAPGTYTKPEEILTVTVPNYVYICPAPVTDSPALPTSTPEPVTPAPAPVVEAPKPVVESPKPVVEAPAPIVEEYKPVVEAPAPVVEAPAPVVEAPKPATTATTPKAKTVSKISTSTGPSLGDNTDHWAITYTPYTYDGQCKGASEVMSDLAEIKQKGFSTIRLYSADKTDCNGLENVSAGCVAHGLYMVLGVFVKNTGLAGAQPQIDELAKFQHWDIVSLVVVGNEAIFAGFCTAPELAAFIVNAKNTFVGAGYNGPVTTTEPLNILQQHASTLCDVVDVMGANIHPFFNSDVSAETCGDFAKDQLDIVDGLCPGKQGINLEIGWPSAGICNGAACPGKDEQRIAMTGVREKLGGKSVFFSFHDDLWKEPGEFGCERSWGIGGLF